MFDKPIVIQTQNPETEVWSRYMTAHATVNKASGVTTKDAGADQFQLVMNFDIRYSRKLESIRYGVQPYRIVYRDNYFKITDYDDYFEQHKTIRLKGELYG